MAARGSQNKIIFSFLIEFRVGKMLLELRGKRGVKKKVFFFLQLKSIFQIYSLQKQIAKTKIFELFQKGRIKNTFCLLQNVFLDNTNSNGSRRAWVAVIILHCK